MTSETTTRRQMLLPTSQDIPFRLIDPAASSASSSGPRCSERWVVGAANAARGIDRDQRIAAGASATAALILRAVGEPDPANLVIVDPRVHAVEIARACVSGTNALAAEAIAAARNYDGVVRVSAGNASGHYAERVVGAGLDLAIWDPFPTS